MTLPGQFPLPVSLYEDRFGGFRPGRNRRPDLEVVGEAASGEEAVAGVTRLDPDVVLMDCRIATTRTR